MSRSVFDKRKQRVRFRLRTAAGGRPRLSVFRSNRHIYAQLIDDREGRTVVAASTVEGALRSASGADRAAAGHVGSLIAERALAAGHKEVVFDRGGYQYHGRVKALAEAAREGGLSF